MCLGSPEKALTLSIREKPVKLSNKEVPETDGDCVAVLAVLLGILGSVSPVKTLVVKKAHTMLFGFDYVKREISVSASSALLYVRCEDIVLRTLWERMIYRNMRHMNSKNRKAHALSYAWRRRSSVFLPN